MDVESTRHREIEGILRKLTERFGLVLVPLERIEEDCLRLHEAAQTLPIPARVESLSRLLPLLEKKTGAAILPIYRLLEEAAEVSPDPWTLLRGMLSTRNASLAREALDLMVRRVEAGELPVDHEIAECLASRLESEDSPFSDVGSLNQIATLLRHLLQPFEDAALDPPLNLYLHGREPKLRRMAARVLDLDGEPAPSELAERVLGVDAYRFLKPYLDYTRATRSDLLHLVSAPGKDSVMLPSLRTAEALCGERLLREVLAELGWSRVNLGLEVQRLVGLSINRAFPLVVSPAEVALFEDVSDRRRTFQYFLFVTHGGTLDQRSRGSRGDPSVDRFREINKTHSEMLVDLLDVSPLSREKVTHLLNRMDTIVNEFVALFAAHSTDCAILPDVYRDIKTAILAELTNETREPALSTELTRLVTMFEDPQSLGEVTTLHGLKRYLHQKGLRLAFRLLESGRSTDCSVAMAVCSDTQVLRVHKNLHYVDFEPHRFEEGVGVRIPYPVRIVSDGFCRHLLHGLESVPSVKVYCYGNEVQYYITYLNHPAFVRIDFSPPLRGGMIDLEYFGVSKFELTVHPRPSLDAVRRFFRRLEFDIEIDSTRIHARYDKERALDLGDLCEKAESLFRLAPYLMASCARTRTIGIVFYTEKVANPMDSMGGDVAAEQRAHDKPLRRAEGRSSPRR